MATVRENSALESGELPRKGVAQIQRARIAAAMTELVRERGSSGMTVAHIVDRARVSRRTFYEFFDDREDCFLEAFDRAVAKAAMSVRPAYEAAGEWRARIRAALAELLAFLEEEPELGYLCVVGSLSAGPRALDRRDHVASAIVSAVHEGRRVPVVHEGRPMSRVNRSPDRLVAEGVVGAVLAILASRLQGEERQPLIGLLNRLMAMIVLPYLGAEVAEQELTRRAPRSRRSVTRREDPLREVEMRLTYRTVRVLLAIASRPASSNRQVGRAAGITDQGQTSKLLARLQTLGLIDNTTDDHSRGEPNSWSLTAKGSGIAQTLRVDAA